MSNPFAQPGEYWDALGIVAVGALSEPPVAPPTGDPEIFDAEYSGYHGGTAKPGARWDKIVTIGTVTGSQDGRNYLEVACTQAASEVATVALYTALAGNKKTIILNTEWDVATGAVEMPRQNEVDLPIDRTRFLTFRRSLVTGTGVDTTREVTATVYARRANKIGKMTNALSV